MSAFSSLSRLKRSLFRRELALKGELRATKTKTDPLFKAVKARPSLWHKLKTLLLQIAFLKSKERDLLSEIVEVEKRHRMLREKRKLRRLDATQDPLVFAPKPKKRQENGFWFGVFLAYMHRKIVQEPNEPRPR